MKMLETNRENKRRDPQEPVDNSGEEFVDPRDISLDRLHSVDQRIQQNGYSTSQET
jgi:hypothetical protein